MKKLSVIILTFCAFSACAQTKSKIDSIYYLIDTAKVPLNARMWKIETDNAYKYFILQCPCLPSSGKPELTYNMKIEGEVINETEVKTLKTVDIYTLILEAKKFFDNKLKDNYAIFLVEPKDKKFVIHKVVLKNTEKNPGLTDYENIPADTLKKKKP
jgi:hypothetical protein